MKDNRVPSYSANQITRHYYTVMLYSVVVLTVYVTLLFVVFTSKTENNLEPHKISNQHVFFVFRAPTATKNKNRFILEDYGLHILLQIVCCHSFANQKTLISKSGCKANTIMDDYESDLDTSSDESVVLSQQRTGKQKKSKWTPIQV
jgi:hypothetical protein